MANSLIDTEYIGDSTAKISFDPGIFLVDRKSLGDLSAEIEEKSMGAVLLYTDKTFSIGIIYLESNPIRDPDKTEFNSAVEKTLEFIESKATRQYRHGVTSG